MKIFFRLFVLFTFALVAQARAQCVPDTMTMMISICYGDSVVIGNTWESHSGLYSHTYVNAAGCDSVVLTHLHLADSMTLSIPVVNTICGGSAIVHVMGSSPPYLFQWSNGVIDSAITSDVDSIYCVTVNDAAGCDAYQCVTLTPAIFHVVATADSSIGVFNVTLSLSGGAPPCSYIWNNGATTPSLVNIAAGNYCATVTDANGCTGVSCATTAGITPCASAYSTIYDTTANTFYIVMSNASQNWNGGYLWDFGDGATDTAQFPTHNYAVNGLYNVCLNLINANGTTNCTYCHVIGIDSIGNVHTRMDLTGFTMHVVPHNSLGTLNVENEASLVIFPNPVSADLNLNVHANADAVCTVDIYNTLGQRIKSFQANAHAGDNNLHCPVQELSSGLYMATVRLGNATWSRSFAK